MCATSCDFGKTKKHIRPHIPKTSLTGIQTELLLPQAYGHKPHSFKNTVIITSPPMGWLKSRMKKATIKMQGYFHTV
ncbi:hypothetical protein XENTR_v10007918 [Xenopus tropicalis]|nr:hypothetical protein XENTR_v10007918 [Xenopus tropicalis]